MFSKMYVAWSTIRGFVVIQYLSAFKKICAYFESGKSLRPRAQAVSNLNLVQCDQVFQNIGLGWSVQDCSMPPHAN